MMSKYACALAVVVTIAATSPAIYADGTISACPATVSTSGTWTVTADITAAPNVNCISVAATGVSIDLQGHTIKGSGYSSGIINTSPAANIIIANGTITGFNQAINLSTEYTTISNMVVTNAGFSGIDISASYAVVSGSKVSGNGGYGMYFYGSNNTIVSTVASNNGQYGIAFLQSSSNNSVSGSVANANGQYGMYFVNGNNTLTGNVANGNKTGDGIFIAGSGNLLTNNAANGNGSIGISVSCPSNLYGNAAYGNGGGNIVLTPTSAGCALLDNSGLQ